MINETNFNILLIAVIVMAVLTALSRLLPFLISDNSPIMRFFMKENSPIAPLGAAIIMAMTVVLGLPFIQNLNGINGYLATAFGITATIMATLRGINTGFAVLIGMMSYLMVQLLGKFLSFPI